MEQLVPLVVNFAMQSIAEGSSNACMRSTLAIQIPVLNVCSGCMVKEGTGRANMPDEHPVMTTHRFPTRPMKFQGSESS